jgi:hypothetical protein
MDQELQGVKGAVVVAQRITYVQKSEYFYYAYRPKQR